jgi:hypothetical protein
MQFSFGPSSAKPTEDRPEFTLQGNMQFSFGPSSAKPIN